MRSVKRLQQSLREGKVQFSGGDELDEMARILDTLPGITEVYASVMSDVAADKMADNGREGLTAEQIVRLGILRKRQGHTYRRLSEATADSLSVRRFLDLGPGETLSRSAIHANLKAVSEQSWELLNSCLIEYAKEQGYENGSQLRGDTTTVETNIHYPTDASLLNDCVRVLVRELKVAQELVGSMVSFVNHRRRAKKKLYLINNTRGEDKRHQDYLELIRVTRQTVEYAEKAALVVAQCPGTDVTGPQLKECAAALNTFIPRAKIVIDQAYRRIVGKESVPAAEKLVSIFEEHTNIIVKGSRETIFGHKVNVVTGASCLILKLTVLQGNPKDSTLVPQVLADHQRTFGRVPDQAVFDGCFASTDNRDLLKGAGIKELTFCKNLNMPPDSLFSSARVHRLLRNFRAGIEGCISFLKRVFSFRRVLDRTEETFNAALHLGVAACNLTLLARYNIAAAKN